MLVAQLLLLSTTYASIDQSYNNELYNLSQDYASEDFQDQNEAFDVKNYINRLNSSLQGRDQRDYYQQSEVVDPNANYIDPNVNYVDPNLEYMYPNDDGYYENGIELNNNINDVNADLRTIYLNLIKDKYYHEGSPYNALNYFRGGQKKVTKKTAKLTKFKTGTNPNKNNQAKRTTKKSTIASKLKQPTKKKKPTTKKGSPATKKSTTKTYSTQKKPTTTTKKKTTTKKIATTKKKLQTTKNKPTTKKKNSTAKKKPTTKKKNSTAKKKPTITTKKKTTLKKRKKLNYKQKKTSNNTLKTTKKPTTKKPTAKKNTLKTTKKQTTTKKPMTNKKEITKKPVWKDYKYQRQQTYNYSQTFFSAVPGYEINATAVEKSQYPWVARVVHSRSNTYPHVCTAACIDTRIFVTAARSIYSLKVNYTSIIYADEQLHVISIILPSNQTKQQYDDIGILVVKDSERITKWQTIKPMQEQRTDEYFNWFEDLGYDHKPMQHKAVGYAVSQATNYKKTVNTEYTLVELDVMLGIEICVTIYSVWGRIPNSFHVPCYYPCTLNEFSEIVNKSLQENKCKKYLGVEGALVFNTKTNILMGIATWGGVTSSQVNFALPVGVALTNSENFINDYKCAKKISDVKTERVTPGFYGKLCNEP